jgi:RNA polymerase sigma-70 factor (ECF subfamily)
VGISPTRWEALYRQAFPVVYRAVVAVTLNRELALDALQDAFVEGLRRPPATDQNLIGWVYRVALRKARRSRHRAGAVQLRAVPAEDGRLGATLDALEVGRLLDLLTHRQRVVIVAHYFLGLTQLEIAEQLGIKRGTVGATITQSLSRMRREAGHVR